MSVSPTAVPSSDATPTAEAADAAVAAISESAGQEVSFSLELTQDQKDIRDWVHGFAADVVRPAAHEWDEKEKTPWPIIEEAAKIGLYGFEGLAQFFGMRYFHDTQSGQEQIIHSLRTAVIGPDGKVLKVYRGNEWKPEAIEALHYPVGQLCAHFGPLASGTRHMLVSDLRKLKGLVVECSISL